MAGESLAPAVGQILGLNPLQSAADKLSSAADKFSNAVQNLATHDVGQARYQSIGGSTATGSRPGGNGWANKANAGGAVFSGGGGGGGGSQPGGNGWRGKAIGGAAIVGAAGLAARGYANAHMASMTTMDYALNYFSQGTGQGISSLTGLYKNQRYAQNSTDLTQALLQLQYATGTAASPNNAYFNYQRAGLATAVGFDPSLSATQAAGINAGLSGWSNYYRLRMYGINTISGGKIMNMPGQASAVTNLLTGGRKFTSMNQVNATFGQNSNMAWSLKNMGYDDQTIQYILTQGRANSIGQMNGYTPQQMADLMTQAQTGGTAASKQAMATLSKMGFTNTMLQSMNNVTASQTNRDATLLPSFSRGVQDANQALVLFKNALTDVINSLRGPLGFAGGAGGIASGAVGNVMSGLELYGGAKIGSKILGSVLGRGAAAGGASLLGEGGMLAGAAGALPMAGVAAGGAGLSFIGGHYVQKSLSKHGHKTLGKVLGNELRYGGTGAAIGTAIMPGIGSAIGGGIGSAVGGLVDIFGGAGASTPSGAGGGATSAAVGTMGAGKNAAALLSVAARYLGTPYKWGGSSPQSGFDCSGFVQYCFAQIGVKLPRVAADQQKVGQDVSKDALAPGDLVFFGSPAHHVAIVYGNGAIIEAPHTGTSVRIRKFSVGEITNAKRILGSAGNLGAIPQAGTGAGSGTNRLGSFGLGGDIGLTGAYGSVEEVDAISAALAGTTFSGFAMMGNTGYGASGNGATQAAGTSNGSSGASSTGLRGILAQAGFKGSALNMAYAIAMAESGGNSSAHNTNAGTGDNSYGLFQINMLGGLGPARLQQYGLANNDQLLNSLINAQVAYKMSNGGTNWSPWSTFKNGAYKKYMTGYAKGAWEVQNDESTTVHRGEMILSARDADTVRQALMKSLVPAQATGSAGSGGGVALTFGANSINVTVQGTMDTNVATNAAAEIAKALAADKRIRDIAKGNLHG